VGNKTIRPGNTVRVDFDEKGYACIAHFVQKIEKG